MGEDRNSSDDGQRLLDKNDKQHKIHLLSVIGEVEGHETLSANTKTTKYEHVLPKLAEIEDSKEVDGLLLLLNTVGGDVESGLAIAEMVASLSIPTVSLVLGRKPFDRSTVSGIRRLFLYRAEWNDGHPSGQIERNGHWSTTDLRLF